MLAPVPHAHHLLDQLVVRMGPHGLRMRRAHRAVARDAGWVALLRRVAALLELLRLWGEVVRSPLLAIEDHVGVPGRKLRAGPAGHVALPRLRCVPGLELLLRRSLLLDRSAGSIVPVRYSVRTS